MIRIRLNSPLLTASGQTALEVHLEIRLGEFLAVTGPSGSGKTTMLRLIAGLARPRAGRIEFGDALWLDTDQGFFMPPQARRVGLVFQDYALFPNLTVQGNLTYPLERGQSPAIVTELIHIMELEELVGRYPNTLSGGQQQRVALARALVRRPDLLLLDEPLSALDALLRAKLQDYIRRVHERFQLTTILVSHNPEDVRRMADRVLRMENGRITWEGKPPEAGPDMPVLSLKGIIRSLDRSRPTPVALVAIGTNMIAVDLDSGQAGKLKPEMEVVITFQGGRPTLSD